jgi:hypothetical protein
MCPAVPVLPVALVRPTGGSTWRLPSPVRACASASATAPETWGALLLVGTHCT